jgi:serine/threonine protein kinase
VAVYPPMLGRYRVEKELGRGAMGAVYQGRDPKIGRVVAIKTLMLSGEFAPGELDEVRNRFFHEARTAGRLNHPNIVTVFDAGENRELAYIAMEFLKGENLGRHTRPEALLPLPVVVEILARVADALGYAHRNHVVHRDIKPSNIMYEAATDTVKVTDFGIAHIADASRTRTGIVLGTPSYMSPEQLTGGRIGGGSDLFSLGSSLYQLVSGHLPFSGETMAELMFRIANDTPTDIRKLRRDVPEALARVIERALAKQPAARFRSGEEMASALRASYLAARANAA